MCVCIYIHTDICIYRMRQKNLTVFKPRYIENRQVFLPHLVYTQTHIHTYFLHNVETLAGQNK